MRDVTWNTLPAFLVVAVSSIGFVAQPVKAATFNVLYAFHGSKDGVNPLAGLVRDAEGNLYGTTDNGGEYGYGTVFRWNNTLGETVLYSFCPDYSCEHDGAHPFGGLLVDATGNLYGATSQGGVTPNHFGAVFKLANGSSIPWAETLLYSFTDKANGWGPEAALTAAPNGDLFGTTYGANGKTPSGVVFKLTPVSSTVWTESALRDFAGGADGAGPAASLLRDSKGNLYGTTFTGGMQPGGAAGFGVVFRLAPVGNGNWEESVLYTFTGHADGANPVASLIMDSQGNLYGTTESGGCCGGGGVVFKLSPVASGPWTESVLYSFCSAASCADGWEPKAGVIMNAEGDLYGTTFSGGIADRYGVIFKLTHSTTLPWLETVVYSFTGLTDGANPAANLIQDREGRLYGTASAGGASCSCGTIFTVAP